MHDNPTDLRAVLRDYGEEMVLPALELYTKGLMTDSTMYARLSRPARKRPPVQHLRMKAVKAAYECRRRSPRQRKLVHHVRHHRLPAVEIAGLSKSFGHTKALDGLDLTVARRHHRLPRTQRRGQVHHHPGAAGLLRADSGTRPAARRRPLARRGGAAPADRLRAR